MNPGNQDWREKLTEEEYRVMREKGTEPAFSGEYIEQGSDGIYRCKACGTELFSTNDQYVSDHGWPSFTRAKNVEFREDRSHGMVRTEVVCAECGSHLGHVFDADTDTGDRFCINSVALDFEEE